MILDCVVFSALMTTVRYIEAADRIYRVAFLFGLLTDSCWWFGFVVASTMLLNLC